MSFCSFPRWSWEDSLRMYCGEHDACLSACWPFHFYRDGAWWTR